MKIRKPKLIDIPVLQKVIIESFLVPHGHAAPKNIIDEYVHRNFNPKAIEIDLLNPKNEYHIIELNDKIVGFSKIIFNYENENISDKNVTKMERIYLLPSVYGLGLGKKLFDFNVNLAKKNQQKGIWLHVWFNNPRAIKFYEKMGMKNVGYYDFPVSETHSNPNHVLFVEF